MRFVQIINIATMGLLLAVAPSFAGQGMGPGPGVKAYSASIPTISYESSASASNTSGTALVITKPASTASGDMLVVIVVQDGSEGTAVTLPAGWTLIHDIVVSSSRTTVAYKEAGGSEGENYTFTNVDTYKTGVMARFSKSGGTWDIEAASETTSITSSITSASVTATDNSMLLFCWGSDDALTISSAPADMTQIAVTSPGSAHAGMWYEARSAGAITKTLSTTGGGDVAAIAVVLDLVP